jgi:hypothetical protein
MYSIYFEFSLITIAFTKSFFLNLFLIIFENNKVHIIKDLK